MQLSFNFEDNTTPVEIAHKLRMQAGILEGLSPKQAASKKNTTAKDLRAIVSQDEEIETASEDTDEDFATSSPRKGKDGYASCFDEERQAKEFDGQAEEDEADEEPAPKASAKKAKAAKLTIDDLNDACRERAMAEGGGKAGRAAVEAILKKKFKVVSVSAVKPDQYAAVIAAMQA